MKILLLGSRGQLATALRPRLEAAGHLVVGLTHADGDVTNVSQLTRHLDAHRPDAVINTAAYHQVDQCEAEIERAFLTNSYGPRELARLCAERRMTLMHLSTDYVFDGRQQKPYDEAAAPNPLSVYALSKLVGELFVQRDCPASFVIRSCGLYGLHGGRQMGENFVERMIASASAGRLLRVVTDQIVTPTYVGHLAGALVQLLATTNYGLYHVTNSGSCSWWDFARAILKRAGLQAEVQPIRSDAYGAAAPRPAYSVLSSRRCAAAGLAPLPPWEEGLEAYFQERARR